MITASCSLSPLSKNTHLEHISLFKLVKVPKGNRVNDLLKNKTKPVTLYKKLLTFRDTDEKFELQEDLFKMITDKSYKVDFANLSGKKL